MTDKKRVLFVCVHNSARSQIAEAFLNTLAGDRFEAMSAGLEPGVLNPLAVDVMKEAGIDISRNETKNVFDLYKRGELFSYVITVCDAASSEQCPLFPGLLTAQIHWSFADPSSFTGTHEEKLAQTRLVRDAIKIKIEGWLKEVAA
jgi:arsenate reductase (thioredoxin)